MSRKIYGKLTVRIVIEVDDTYTEEDITSTAFLSDYNFEASDGTTIVDTEITEFEITDPFSTLNHRLSDN